MESEKYTGVVEWFNAPKGYGFIARENEKDLFVYWTDIEQEGYKSLNKSDVVEFSIGLNHRGQPKATEVVIVKHAEET